MTAKVLKFSASWCLPCKMLAKNIEGVDVGVPVESVDIDENSELAIQYGIRGVPTLIFVQDDKEVARLFGVQTAASLTRWVSGLNANQCSCS